MISLAWQQEFTWRKLGYLFYTDSLAYREVLAQNPQWDVVTEPPLGAQLRLPSPSVSNGNLKQTSGVYGLPNARVSDSIAPFTTEQSYVEAITKYSLPAVEDRVRLNGYTQDSDESVVGQV
jgi:hypothetical protein